MKPDDNSLAKLRAETRAAIALLPALSRGENDLLESCRGLGISKAVREQFNDLIVRQERQLEELRQIWPKIPFNQEHDDVIALLNPDRPQIQRMEAARRITKRLGNIIHKERWKWVKPELISQARMHKRSMRAELESVVIGRLFEAVKAIETFFPVETDRAYKTLRSKLNYFLTRDLLGPQWRRTTGTSRVQEIPLEEKLTVQSLLSGANELAQFEARLILEGILTRAKLNLREAEVYKARKLGNLSYNDIAKKLKIKVDHARKLNAYAEKKISVLSNKIQKK